jgi:hypothetical protein
MDANFWYPSPETIPGTDFRPGCVWMSSGTRFLQAISIKLTDFAFPTSDQAKQAQTQFEQTPNTLCQAPGRMTLWQTHNMNDCTPYYPFPVERNETTGFDLDYQKIVDGHRFSCNPRGQGYKQNLEPGKGPKTQSPEQMQREKEEQERKNESGQNTNGPAPAAGSFGDICGISANVTPGERADRGIVCPRAIARRRRRQGPQEEKDYCIERLVISHYRDHSAREVCKTETAWGPDFASVEEKLHCNMCTRELLGFCDFDTGGEDCFDLEKKVVRRSLASGVGYGVQNAHNQEVKSYMQVSEWKE